MSKTIQEILGTPSKDTPFSPIPGGKYILFFAEADARPARERQDGTLGFPSVHARLHVVGGEYDNRVLFHDFYVNVDNKDLLGFLKRAYERVTGNDLANALTSEIPTNEEISVALAEGLRGGKLAAKVIVRKNRNGEEANVVSGWVDDVE